MGLRRGLAGALILGAAAIQAPAAVLVAYESGVEAYGEALNGLRATLGPNGIQTLDLRVAGSEALLTRGLGADVQAVVALGSEALAVMRPRNPGAPLIVTMVLRPTDTAGISGYLDVELPLNMILSKMRVLLPRRRRVGIIRSPGQSQQTAEAIEAAARREGYTAVVIDCDSPANLLRAVKALKGKVDFLLCFPDANLYNSVTIRPLILTTLEDRMPVVGFSPAFVHAGAAAGIYPDYYEMGRQTGEMVLRIVRGESHVPRESPRRVRAAVNARIARLLGVEFQTGSGTVEVFR